MEEAGKVGEDAMRVRAHLTAKPLVKFVLVEREEDEEEGEEDDHARCHNVSP
jgi:hypothetical protein